MSSIKMKRFVSIKGVIDKLTTSSPAPPSANPANSDRVALETHIIENMNGSQASSIMLLNGRDIMFLEHEVIFKFFKNFRILFGTPYFTK